MNQPRERKYLAFDLEIHKEVPEDGDWKEIMPLGITCASTVSSDGIMRTWYPKDEQDRPLKRAMTIEEVDGLVAHLHYMWKEKKYIPLTWNGLAFDFAVLHDECGDPMKGLCKELAVNHVDMMYHFFCIKGFRLGLDTANKGMGLAGKTEGMSGAKAPEMWQKSPLYRLKVLNYVDMDSIATLELALEVEKCKRLNWISRSERPNTCRFNDGWLIVDDASKLPKPNTSWMDTPILRSEYFWWL